MARSLDEFKRSNCRLRTENETVFVMIFDTVGDPCPGCYRRLLGKCPGPRDIAKAEGTNKELAAKLGISKRQVAKLRAAGTLEQELNKFK